MAFKFPDPKRCTIEHMVVFCTAERILNLYNQGHTADPKERIVRKVQDWFTLEAQKYGWAGTKFLPASESVTTIAGCILAAPSRTDVTVHLKVIKIHTDDIPKHVPIAQRVDPSKVVIQGRQKSKKGS